MATPVSIDLGTFQIPSDLRALIGVLRAFDFHVIVTIKEGQAIAVAVPDTPALMTAIGAALDPAPLPDPDE